MQESKRDEQSVVDVSLYGDFAAAVQAEPEPAVEQVDPEVMANRAKIFKVALILLAVGCCILLIFILAKSSQFFSFLFTLTSEVPGKHYLSQNYKAFMCSLYISIFGFVLVTANTVLFFYRFTQKDKILYIHVGYFLAFFISSIVALAQKAYRDHMDSMGPLNPADPLCVANGYLNECLLSSEYASYRSNYVSFFVVFTIFFVSYTVAYHYAVKKVLPFVVQQKKQESQQDERRSSIMNANKKNETLVSEMFDEYMN